MAFELRASLAPEGTDEKKKKTIFFPPFHRRKRLGYIKVTVYNVLVGFVHPTGTKTA